MPTHRGVHAPTEPTEPAVDTQGNMPVLKPVVLRDSTAGRTDTEPESDAT